MIEVIYGRIFSASIIDDFIANLKSSNINGTLYLGYPILSTPDDPITIDALLVSEEFGPIIFDLTQAVSLLKEQNSDERIEEIQDLLYGALYNKLHIFPELRKRRDLAVEIHVISLLPEVYDDTENIKTTTIDNLIKTIEENETPFDHNYYRPLNAAIESVTTIKPKKKRLNVTSETTKGAILKKIEKEISNLDRWQKKAAIECPEGPQRIRGLAGSGKTVVLALKAAHLHTSHPDWKIAVTFHTRSLYQQFIDLVRRFTFDAIRDDPDFDKLQILHSWGSAREIGFYSIVASSVGHPVRDFTYGKNHFSYSLAFQGVVSELLRSLPNDNSTELFDAVLIDEAQDFPPEFFRLVYAFTKHPKRIVWAYDELQNLGDYSMESPERLFGKNSDGDALVTLSNDDSSPRQDIVLPVCYRNTPWALTVAHALGFGIYLEGGSLVQMFDDPTVWSDVGYEVKKGEFRQGQRVELARKAEHIPAFFQELLKPKDAVIAKKFANRDSQAEWIASQIAQNLTTDQLEIDDILIILTNPINASKESSIIINYLRERGLSAHIAGVTSSRDILFRKDSVAITGIYRAKGNEAPVVYIANADYCYSGLELIRKRNIIFTAITRSRGWVNICGCGEHMSALKAEIDKVVANNYRLSFKIPTEIELKKLRKIHRDLTTGEKEVIEKRVSNMETLVRMLEDGVISVDSLPPGLVNKLKKMLRKSG